MIYSSALKRTVALCGIFWYVLMIIVAPAVAAQSPPPDLATYEGWLREARVAAERGDRLGLEQVAPNLIDTTEVQIGESTTLPVDNSWLREALDDPDPDLERIALRLGAVIDALTPTTATTSEDALQRLRTILSRPPFATAEPEREGFFERFLDALFRLLDRLFGSVDVGPGVGRPIVWLIIIMGGILVAGTLIYLIFNMQRSFVHEARADSEADPEANLTANTALQQASTLARGGDYRTAVRYLYLSSLLWLDERGMLRYDRALTNHEYLDRLVDNAELQSRLTPIIDTFDRVWYGYAVLDDESFAAYERQVNDLRRVRV